MASASGARDGGGAARVVEPGCTPRRDANGVDDDGVFPFMCDADGMRASGAALEGVRAPPDLLKRYPHGVYTVGKAQRRAARDVGVDAVAGGGGAFALTSAEFHVDRLTSRDARRYIAHGRDGSATASTSSASAPTSAVSHAKGVEDVEEAFRAKVTRAIALALDHATTNASAECECVVVTVSVHRANASSEAAMDGDIFDGVPWICASAVDVKALVTSYAEFETSDKTFGAYVDVDSSARVRRSPVSVKYAEWIHGRAKASAALADWNAQCERCGLEHLKCVEYLLTKSSTDDEEERLELLEGLTSNFLLICDVDGALTGYYAKPGVDVLDGVAARALRDALSRRGIPLIARAPNAAPLHHRTTWVAAYLTSAIKGVVPLDFILFRDGDAFHSAPLPASRATLHHS